MKEDTILHTIRTLWQGSNRDLEDVISDFHYIMKQIDKDQISWSEWCSYNQDEIANKLMK